MTGTHWKSLLAAGVVEANCQSQSDGTAKSNESHSQSRYGTRCVWQICQEKKDEEGKSKKGRKKTKKKQLPE